MALASVPIQLERWTESAKIAPGKCYRQRSIGSQERLPEGEVESE